MSALPLSRPALTTALTRGVMRLWLAHGFAPVTELPLANGRRADVAALGPKGEIVLVEVKSCMADYAADAKWRDYLEHADAFYFAVGESFPLQHLPEGPGLIVADGFGGAILREAPRVALSGARRKALTIAIARLAALRLVTGGEAQFE